MKNLLPAIYSKATGTAFSTAIGGRIYQRVPQGVTWPYAKFFIVSAVPEDTFKDSIEDVTFQFSLFSKASSSAEILDLLSALKDVYDNTILSITGYTQVMLRRTGGGGPVDVFDDTSGGEGRYWQVDVEYNVIMQKT